MRILLDECLPARFQRELRGHEVRTVPQEGWASIKNGKLLQLIADSGKFDVFLTVDKSLPHQNKTQTLPFAIVVLRTKANRLSLIRHFAPELLRHLADFRPGNVYVLTQPD